MRLASFVAQVAKNLPAVWETWVWSLGWEDPLAKGKATHSSILAWRIPWTLVHEKSQMGLSDFHFHFLKWDKSMSIKCTLGCLNLEWKKII